MVSAVFDSRAEAERAVAELRQGGVHDKAVSIVARHDEEGHDRDHQDDDSTRTGLGVGMGVGALLGFGSLLIPGVGPFIAAGALAETLGVTGGAIAAGALTGTAAGGLAGALKEHGVSDDDSHYYEDRIRQGGVFVSVDARDVGLEEGSVREILHRLGGHSASQARTAAI
jgi:uncharacterized membrane protein